MKHLRHPIGIALVAIVGFVGWRCVQVFPRESDTAPQAGLKPSFLNDTALPQAFVPPPTIMAAKKFEYRLHEKNFSGSDL